MDKERWFMKRKEKKVAVLLILLLLVLSSVALTGCSDKQSVPGSSELKKGVVCIFNSDGGATGTGFGVGKVGEETDIYVTNRHVIYDEDNGKLSDEVYILLNDDAVVITIDDNGNMKPSINRDSMVKCEILYPKEDSPAYPDLAILKAERPIEGRVALELKKVPRDNTLEGEHVRAFGYPGILSDARAVTKYDKKEIHLMGDVSSALMTEGPINLTFQDGGSDDTYTIEHQANVHPGNSGGPLIMDDGTVIGINTSILNVTDNYGRDGEFNYSIFIDYAMRELDNLGIKYNIKEKSNDSLIYIGVAVLVIIIALVAIIFAIKNKGKKKKQPVSPKEPKPSEALYLEGVSGYYAGKRISVASPTRIGRRSSGNELVYPPDTKGVSGIHCKIYYENNRWYLEDSGSTYGTFYNDKKLEEGSRVILKSGDSIRLGGNIQSFLVK